MTNDLNSRLVYLSEELASSYEKEYSSDDEEYFENKRMKSELVDFIIDANSRGEMSFVDNAFEILLENTGCQEDFEILEEILRPVIEKKIIDEDLLEKHLQESPLSRWL
ncbi:hypothetical protein [Pectobacterium versatile]|uniref:hypothetical protein n=1 Tax=Pectobacterium versatile TaxID=2488639 RepID=UPI001F46BD73|nr:hypothetical protein [Pectobacterium versatile]